MRGEIDHHWWRKNDYYHRTILRWLFRGEAVVITLIQSCMSQHSQREYERGKLKKEERAKLLEKGTRVFFCPPTCVLALIILIPSSFSPKKILCGADINWESARLQIRTLSSTRYRNIYLRRRRGVCFDRSRATLTLLMRKILDIYIACELSMVDVNHFSRIFRCSGCGLLYLQQMQVTHDIL